MATRYEVVACPGLMDLSIALFDRQTPRRSVHMCVHFDELGSDDIVEVIINRLEREDGSGLRWLYRGYCPTLGGNVTGYLNLEVRKGWIETDVEKGVGK